MDSNVVSYALLAIIFVFTGLRMFLEKPSRIAEIPRRPRRVIHQTRNR
jgi:hypothetical protein